MNLLDTAIEAANYLVVVVKPIGSCPIEPSAAEELEDMLYDVRRAKIFSGGLRRLTGLMNHEKY